MHPDAGRPPSIPQRNMHAVGELLADGGVHCLAIAGAAQVSKSGSRDETACRLLRMVRGRQKPPV